MMRASALAKPLLLAVLTGALLAPAAVTAEAPRVLDRDGAIITLLGGAYQELFPDGTETSHDHSVLALNVHHLDDRSERWLVPGTESRDLEGARTLVLEDRSQVVYVLWESLFNDLHPIFYLTSFDGTAFSEVIEIVSDPFARKGSPQLVVTRESVTDAASGGEIDRTLLHLTWWQEAQGVSRKLYTPIIIQDGIYQGRSPIIDLARFSPEGGELPEISPFIEDAIVAFPGEDSRSVVTGYIDRYSHRLVTLRMQVIPRALVDFIDKARAEFIVIGNKVGSYRELAEQMRRAMLEIGEDLHVAIRLYLAEHLAAMLEEIDGAPNPDDILSMADKARAEFIVIGLKLGPNGVVDAGGEVLAVGPILEDGAHHLVGVTRMSDHAAPEVDGPTTLFVSDSGKDVLVAWEPVGQERRIYYRQSTADSWTDPAFLELGQGLDRQGALQMLEQRIRGR